MDEVTSRYFFCVARSGKHVLLYSVSTAGKANRFMLIRQHAVWQRGEKEHTVVGEMSFCVSRSSNCCLSGVPRMTVTGSRGRQTCGDGSEGRRRSVYSCVHRGSAGGCTKVDVAPHRTVVARNMMTTTHVRL